MFSKGGTSLIAILLASSAAAAPLSAGQSDNVQAVIGAIKAQLKAQNISGDVFVDEVEAHLKDVGILDDKTISELNNEFEIMTSEGGMSFDDIAEIVIEEFKSVDAIQKRDQEGIAKDTVVIDPDVVKRVMAQEAEAYALCPPGAKKGGICCPM